MGYSQWEYESHKSFPHRDLRNHIIDWKASGKSTKCPWAWANFCPASQRSLSLGGIDVVLEFIFLLLQWNTFVQYKNKYLPFFLSLSICRGSPGQSPRLEPRTPSRLSPRKAPQGLGRLIFTSCFWLGCVTLTGSHLPDVLSLMMLGHESCMLGTLSNNQALVCLLTRERNET